EVPGTTLTVISERTSARVVATMSRQWGPPSDAYAHAAPGGAGLLPHGGVCGAALAAEPMRRAQRQRTPQEDSRSRDTGSAVARDVPLGSRSLVSASERLPLICSRANQWECPPLPRLSARQSSRAFL